MAILSLGSDSRCLLVPPTPATHHEQVKAVEADLSSAGGSIIGAVTGVDVRLSSGGGAVQLKSLVGKQAAVDSGGGGIILGACYADSLRLQSGGSLELLGCRAARLCGLRKCFAGCCCLPRCMLPSTRSFIYVATCRRADTPCSCRCCSAYVPALPARPPAGGGPVRISNMDCREGAAELASAGGSVAVDSLDGNLAISSAGGDVQASKHGCVAPVYERMTYWT